MAQITIWEFLEDHDNAELGHFAWLDHMEEMVEEYNKENNTTYHPKNTVLNYINRKTDGDQ